MHPTHIIFRIFFRFGLFAMILLTVWSCKEKTNEEKLIGEWEFDSYQMTYWGAWVNMKSQSEVEFYEAGGGGCYYTLASYALGKREFQFNEDHTFYYNYTIAIVPWEFCDWSSGPDNGTRVYELEHTGTWEMMEAGDGYAFGDRVKLYLHPCGEYFQVWALNSISNRKIDASFYTEGKKNCNLPPTQWTGSFEARAH